MNLTQDATPAIAAIVTLIALIIAIATGVSADTSGSSDKPAPSKCATAPETCHLELQQV